MTNSIQDRLRDNPPHTASRAPTGLTDRVRAAVRDEPQIPDHHGFEMRRIGPVAAAVLVALAVVPFLVRTPPPPEASPQSGARIGFDTPIHSYALRVDQSYATELAGLQADADRITASLLRSWQPFARD